MGRLQVYYNGMIVMKNAVPLRTELYVETEVVFRVYVNRCGLVWYHII